MKKIIYISGSRSDYYLMRKVLLELDKVADLTIIATCMHLSPQFGTTIDDIENDNLKVKKVDMLIDSNTLDSMVKSFGIGVYGITQVVEEINPEIIFVEGDRGESLAGAIIGAYLNIPIVHHGGGDVAGSIDNKIRYAITAFSDYHFVGNEDSYWRLVRMGIQNDRIYNVGEPGLDSIHAKEFTTKEELIQKYNINSKKPLVLLIQHPNTEEYKDVELQIKETLDAVNELKVQTIAVYSNADSGGRIINQALEEYSKKNDSFEIFKNIGKDDFLGLMNICDIMVGNSSAGIVELPSFKKPFVCVGTRQKSRLRAGNTIDVDYDKEQIIMGIKKALYDKEFLKSLESRVNPYGEGNTSTKIVNLLLRI
jgi:UDP-hydrolysing UDP-N-acetyl-D-glucosamine 2-epimerase